MEFLRVLRRRSFLSEFVYIGLNIALAVAVLAIVRAVESPVPALILVLVSKWRVFAVRPRYWVANIQANLVDFTVSVSTVVLLYSVSGGAQAGLVAQIIITLLYIAWLVYLKPRSSKRSVVLQAGAALVAGTSALFMTSYGWPVEGLIIGMAIIGYVVARHVFTQYEEDHVQFLSLLYAFLLVQFSWLFYHWVIAYSLPFIEVRIPQAAIILTVISFAAFKVYDSYKKHDKVEVADVAMPVSFSIAITALLLVLFSSIPVGSL